MDQRRQDPTSATWWRAPAVRRGVALVVGVVVGVGGGVLLLGADDRVDRGSGRSGRDDRDALLAAWRRSERVTVTLEGTFRRTIEGAEPVTDRFVVVQRPPDRVALGFGSWDGVVRGRSVHCTHDGRDGEFRGCTWGAATDRRSEVDEVTRMISGPTRSYRVTQLDDGCFSLRLVDGNLPVAYGLRTRVCFDRRTGALVRRRVTHERGVDETVATDVSATVDESDLPTPP